MAKSLRAAKFLKDRKEKGDKNRLERGMSETVQKLTDTQKKFVEGLSKNSKFKVVSPKQIDFADLTNQIRKTDISVKEKEELKESLAKGQEIPVLLRDRGFGKKYQIISGFTRCLILKELEKNIEAKIYSEISDTDCIRLAVTENLVRNDLKPRDVLKLIGDTKKSLAEEKATVRDIADTLGLSKTQVAYYLKISQFNEIVSLLNKGSLSFKDAIYLANTDEKKRNKIVGRIAKAHDKSPEEGQAAKKQHLDKEKSPTIIINKQKNRIKIAGISGTIEDAPKIILQLETHIKKLKAL